MPGTFMEIVGHYDDDGGVRHGFLRSAAGATTTIDFPGAVQSLVGGINDSGDMVGTHFDGSGTPHGFLWSGGVFEAFNVPGAVGTVATGINEAGQITGEFTDDLGIRRGFVATPHLFTDGFESGDTAAWATPQVLALAWTTVMSVLVAVIVLMSAACAVPPHP